MFLQKLSRGKKKNIHLEGILQRRYPFRCCYSHNVTLLLKLRCCDGTALQYLFDGINIIGGFLRSQMYIAEIALTDQCLNTKVIDVHTQIICFFDDSIIYPGEMKQ